MEENKIPIQPKTLENPEPLEKPKTNFDFSILKPHFPIIALALALLVLVSLGIVVGFAVQKKSVSAPEKVSKSVPSPTSSPSGTLTPTLNPVVYKSTPTLTTTPTTTTAPNLIIWYNNGIGSAGPPADWKGPDHTLTIKNQATGQVITDTRTNAVITFSVPPGNYDVSVSQVEGYSISTDICNSNCSMTSGNYGFSSPTYSVGVSIPQDSARAVGFYYVKN